MAHLLSQAEIAALYDGLGKLVFKVEGRLRHEELFQMCEELCGSVVGKVGLEERSMSMILVGAGGLLFDLFIYLQGSGQDRKLYC